MCRAKHLPLLKVKAATIGSPSARLMMVGQVHHVRKTSMKPRHHKKKGNLMVISFNLIF